MGLERTRERILSRLRRSAATTAELADELKLTKNAVRVALLGLARDGFVQGAGYRPGARRPFQLFVITDKGAARFERGGAALLPVLLRRMEGNLSREALIEEARATGRDLARPFLERAQQLAPPERLQLALDLLNSLGGIAELSERDGLPTIQGYGCPLGGLVREFPWLCIIAEEFVRQISGQQAAQVCAHGDRPRCCFELPA